MRERCVALLLILFALMTFLEPVGRFLKVNTLARLGQLSRVSPFASVFSNLGASEPWTNEVIITLRGPSTEKIIPFDKNLYSELAKNHQIGITYATFLTVYPWLAPDLQDHFARWSFCKNPEIKSVRIAVYDRSQIPHGAKEVTCFKQ